MNVIQYSESDAEQWDAFLLRTAQGTVLHSRRFLGYHAGRFKDVSLMVVNESGQIRAVLPAAESHESSHCVISHPGSTYGGVLYEPGCRADEVMLMIDALMSWYQVHGYELLVYKAVPHHIYRVDVECDLYALWRRDARLLRRDLWNVLNLDRPRKLSKGHSWSYKKAAKMNMQVIKLDESMFE